jgi:hypothetical protein
MPPYNGSGTFSPPAADYPAVTATVINSTKRNNVDADFASGLTNCITRDGQSPPTANIPLGSFKLTGAGAATAAGDVVSLSSNLGITITSAGARIMGDFTSAGGAQNSRLSFQSSTANGQTAVQAIPNGTSVISSFQALDGTDAANVGVITFGVNATAGSWSSGMRGTGVLKPLTVVVGAFTPTTFNTDGTVTNTGVHSFADGLASGASSPVLKFKKLTGTMAAVGGSFAVAHGLTLSKILGVQFLVTDTYGSKIAPVSTNVAADASYYEIETQASDIYSNTGASATDIAGQPFTILITYEA